MDEYRYQRLGIRDHQQRGWWSLCVSQVRYYKLGTTDWVLQTGYCRLGTTDWVLQFCVVVVISGGLPASSQPYKQSPLHLLKASSVHSLWGSHLNKHDYCVWQYPVLTHYQSTAVSHSAPTILLKIVKEHFHRSTRIQSTAVSISDSKTTILLMV